MKAAVTTGRNDHNIVEIREIDILKPGPNDILVKVMAAAANPTDCMHDIFLKYQIQHNSLSLTSLTSQ